MADKEKELISQAMSVLGSRKSPAKAAASRANATVAHEARRKNPLDLPCTCSGGESMEASDHKTTCPRGHLLWQRERSAQKKAQKV